MQRISRGEQHLEVSGRWDMDNTAVMAELEGWLLKSKEAFPYFLLVAMEAGSVIRAIFLLLAYPLAWLLTKIAVWEDAALKLYVFIACVGVRMVDIEAVGRAVLPRFMADDVRAHAWKAFSACAASRRLVISALPRVMLQSFVRDQLGAQQLIAPDLHVMASGRCTGFLKNRRRQLGPSCSSIYLQELLCTTAGTQFSSKSLQETGDDQETVCMSDLQSPVVFHDGRLVRRPTPAVALLVFLWMPLGFILSVVRVGIGTHVPYCVWPTVTRLLGMQFNVKGELPADRPPDGGPGLLFVCNHRTLLDPIFVSMAVGWRSRPLTAATYSLSRLSEVLSPIHTVRLERDAERDLQKLKGLIEEGRDVVVCPEGTTSREALLLRFSALFAQVSDDIVPVAVHTRADLFYGTSARGFKALDPFFYLMNPVPAYELTFLPRLPPSMTCGSGTRSRLEVANHVQQLIASTLGFECSSFTRLDKYRFLAGTDGSVPPCHVK